MFIAKALLNSRHSREFSVTKKFLPPLFLVAGGILISYLSDIGPCACSSFCGGAARPDGAAAQEYFATACAKSLECMLFLCYFLHVKQQKRHGEPVRREERMDESYDIIRCACTLYACLVCRTKTGWQHQGWCELAGRTEPACGDCRYYNREKDTCAHPARRKGAAHHG